MNNCNKVFVNGRLFAIVHTFSDACALANMLYNKYPDMVTVGIERAYIPNIGF